VFGKIAIDFSRMTVFSDRRPDPAETRRAR
jgi:hypothetical protein